jgi:hypothetical protein
VREGGVGTRSERRGRVESAGPWRSSVISSGRKCQKALCQWRKKQDGEFDTIVCNSLTYDAVYFSFFFSKLSLPITGYAILS